MEKDKFLFNSDEEFEFFIGHTQAYVNMQNEISKVVKFAHPEYLIEFGSGSGKTSIRLAKENPRTSIVAVDLREKMTNISKDKSKQNRIKNVTFVNGDLTKLDNFNLKNCNLILLAYSFKYIQDPIETKFDFLSNLYKRMQKGAYVVIGDTFIDPNAPKAEIRQKIQDRYYDSSKDAFWNNLNGLTDEDVKYALDAQALNREHTAEQVERGVNREGVYYVSREWLRESAEKIGFKVVLGERLDSLSDMLFVLVK